MPAADKSKLDSILAEFPSLFDYYGDSRLKNCVLEKKGVHKSEAVSNSVASVDICKQCWKHRSSKKLPKFALANGLWRGNFRDFGLPELSFVEQMVIAKAVPITGIVKLTPELGAGSQLGTKGNYLIMNFQPDTIYYL
jgi:hypothetical protein